MGFQNHTLNSAFKDGLDVIGLCQNQFRQKVDILPSFTTDMNHWNVAPHRLNFQSSLVQTSFCGFCICIWQVNFIDGYDAWNLLLIYDFYHFWSLFLNALSRRYNQNYKISHHGSSFSHICERLVTRSVNERNLLSMALDMKGTNFLGDTTVLFLCNVRIS